jgi:hypothetical protein
LYYSRCFTLSGRVVIAALPVEPGLLWLCVTAARGVAGVRQEAAAGRSRMRD